MSTTFEQLFSIGSVVKFTGLTSHAIRVWEKRYKAVEPQRLDNGRRMYTQNDVHRLSTLKQCTDLGKSISSIAHLSDDELASCLANLKENLLAPTSREQHENESTKSLALLGNTHLINETEELTNIRLDICATEFTHFFEEVLKIYPNIIIMEVPSLSTKSVEEVLSVLTQSTPDHLIVVYRFANQQNSNKLIQSGVTLIRAPLSRGTINRAIINGAHSPSREISIRHEDQLAKPYPKRLFTSEQLDNIKELLNTLKCECPHHLSEIINGLLTFEQYSADCINETDKDAALHANIQRRTAQARHDMEALLKDILDMEDITI